MPDTFIEGSNRITVDIRDRDLTKVGPGPLMTCLGFDGDTLLSQAGSFSARFPANDPRLAYLQLKKHFLWFHVDGTVIFRGLAETWRVEVGNDGQMILIVEGRDELAELAETSIDFTEITEDSEPVFNAPSLVLIAYNILGASSIQWINANFGETDTAVYGSFAGEPALTALTKIAEHIGESFRLAQGENFSHSIEWLGATVEASGVRAIASAGDAIDAENNPHVCFIQGLTERRDASRMITKIYPYGAGLGETRLDLAGTSRSSISNFILNETDNSISSVLALAYIGKVIARHVNFKDIRPLFNTDADIQYAKDFLFDSALAYLQRNDSVDDVVEYDLDVLQLPAHVRVGMSLRVVYQDDRYDLDTDLVLLGIRQSVDSNGASTFKLTVAANNQWRLRESSAIVAQMEEGELFAAHPQIDANSYWENFREEVGDSQTDHIAEFPFVLSEEIVTIRQVLFRYRVDRILTGTNSYAYADANTGASSAASTGGTAAGTTESGGSGTSGPTAAGTTTSSGSGTTGGTSLTVPETSGLSSGETGVTSEPPLDGNFTNSNYNNLGEATQDPGITWGDPATHYHQIGPHIHEFNHIHVTPLHPHDIDHGHTIDPDPHTHSTPNHTHSITDTHTHTTPAHGHTITTTHTHTMAHTHPMPELEETFTVRRVPALNSYAMADLEYSVNGGVWASLGVENLDVIPKANGYFQIDITPAIQNPDGLKRPYQEDNLIEVRRKSEAGTGKTALVRAKIGIRSTIQSIVVYS